MNIAQAHCTFTIRSLCIHYIFTICSQYIHNISTIHSLYVHHMFTICSLYVHYLFTICSLYIYSLYIFTICSLYVHYIYTIYSLYIHYIFKNSKMHGMEIWLKMNELFSHCSYPSSHQDMYISRDFIPVVNIDIHCFPYQFRICMKNLPKVFLEPYVGGHHPNIWKFLDILKREQNLAQVK